MKHGQGPEPRRYTRWCARVAEIFPVASRAEQVQRRSTNLAEVIRELVVVASRAVVDHPWIADGGRTWPRRFNGPPTNRPA